MSPRQPTGQAIRADTATHGAGTRLGTIAIIPGTIGITILGTTTAGTGVAGTAGTAPGIEATTAGTIPGITAATTTAAVGVWLTVPEQPITVA